MHSTQITLANEWSMCRSQGDWQQHIEKQEGGTGITSKYSHLCTPRLPGLHAQSLPLLCLPLVECQHDVCGMRMLEWLIAVCSYAYCTRVHCSKTLASSVLYVCMCVHARGILAIWVTQPQLQLHELCRCQLETEGCISLWSNPIGQKTLLTSSYSLWYISVTFTQVHRLRKNVLFQLPRKIKIIIGTSTLMFSLHYTWGHHVISSLCFLKDQMINASACSHPAHASCL